MLLLRKSHHKSNALDDTIFMNFGYTDLFQTSET